MGKKQDTYYFNTFTACAEDACRAAQLLKSVLENFKPEELETQLEKLHEIEHSADEKKHDIMDHLAKEFIPPIEREDIVSLSQNIDNVTDKVEDILLRVYMNNVSRIGEDALAMMDVVVQCCEAVRELCESGDAGDVLVFLPGAYEIRRTVEILERVGWMRGRDVFPLHGQLSPEAQARAVERGALSGDHEYRSGLGHLGKPRWAQNGGTLGRRYFTCAGHG